MKKPRAANWGRVAGVALAGFCLGSGCNVRALNAVVVGVQAAADELNGRDDDSFLDWLDNKFDDDVDDLGDLFD
jgi:hypothetical protein